MKRFKYLRPITLNEALEMLAKYKGRAKPFIGGTDLIVRVKKGQADIDVVIDLKQVAEISSTVEKNINIVTVGSKVVLSDLVDNRYIRKYFPALTDGASLVGSTQIRNRATLTGNICNASPAADTVPPLIVYHSSVVIAGIDGRRKVLLKDFFLGPGKTLCDSTELVVSIQIPIPEKPFGASFGRITRRKGVDLATVNLACGIDSKKTTTFVFGSVGPTPITVTDESGRLAEIECPEDTRNKILKSLIQYASPISDVRGSKEYREAMLVTLSQRVLEKAQQRYSSIKG